MNSIDKRHRGRGIGRHLWEQFEIRLQAESVRECPGAFFSHGKRRPELPCARYGFRVFDRRRTTLFQPEISDPVEVVCVSKRF